MGVGDPEARKEPLKNRKRRSKYIGPLLIHAPAKLHANRRMPRGVAGPREGEIVLRKVLGIVDVVGVVDKARSKWWDGPHALVLENPRSLKKPIPWMKGKLGLWTPPPELIRRVRRQLRLSSKERAAPAMKKLSMFSWGFSGWGNATPELVAAVDAAERKRGFNPPVFVDIRFKRTGRAKGFKEHTFEDLLGWRRYRWMPTLGNSSIGTRKGKMKIASPKAARQLLDVALEASDRSARVIFFCACESPFATWCHRHQVTELLRREARLQKKSRWTYPSGPVGSLPSAL